MIAQAEAIDTLEEDLVSFANEINSLHGKLTIETVLSIGERLEAAHVALAHKGNGKFNKWVDESLNISRMAANRYMKTYRTFGGMEECNSLLQTSTIEAIYSLARKPELIDEAVELAESGERITLSVVKELTGSPSKDDKPLTMPRAMLRLQRVLRNIVEWFPSEHQEALGQRLIAAGDEILTTGGIR